jgi:proton glutamate symport protein
MDMARTATNVLGNCLATVAVARWEGEFKDEGNEIIDPADTVLSPQAREQSVS